MILEGPQTVTMRNSTETHEMFVVKKAVGFALGMISALCACGVYIALRRIVYPPDKCKNSSNDGYRARSESAAVYMIVLKLFMATAVCDIIFSLNNLLTFLDWDPNSLACKVRGAWFQVGFQSSFMFTAFTAFELYRMVSLRQHGWLDEYVRCRLVFYMVITIVSTVVIVAILSVYDSWGAITKTNRHTLCYIKETNSRISGVSWRSTLALAPSAISWISLCILVVLVTHKICLLSTNVTDSEAQDHIQRQSRVHFQAFIKKMVAFPCSTFFIWLLPLLYIIILIKYDSFPLELLMSAIMNSQGLKNALLLFYTNSLVREEVSGWFSTCECAISCLCCFDNNGSGTLRSDNDSWIKSTERDTYVDSSYIRMSNGEDYDNFQETQLDETGDTASEVIDRHLYANLLTGSRLEQERNRAVTEDVIIGAVRDGSDDESFEDGYDNFSMHTSRNAASEFHNGNATMGAQLLRQSNTALTYNNVSPQMPSTNSIYGPGPPSF